MVQQHRGGQVWLNWIIFVHDGPTFQWIYCLCSNVMFLYLRYNKGRDPEIVLVGDLFAVRAETRRLHHLVFVLDGTRLVHVAFFP